MQFPHLVDQPVSNREWPRSQKKWAHLYLFWHSTTLLSYFCTTPFAVNENYLSYLH